MAQSFYFRIKFDNVLEFLIKFIRKSVLEYICFFAWVEALYPSQQFFSHVVTYSWDEPVLSNEDENSSSRTQHHAPGEI